MVLKLLIMTFDEELVLGMMSYSGLTISLAGVFFINGLPLIFLRSYYKLRLVTFWIMGFGIPRAS